MNELIDALRNCACIKTDASCANCGYARSTECKWRMIEDAADAIERLQAENDELRAEKDSAERHEKDFFLKLLFATDEQLAQLRDEARRQVRDLIILGEEQTDEPIRPN